MPPATFKAKVVTSRYSSTDEIVKVTKGETKGVQVIDARTEKEYNGKESRSTLTYLQLRLMGFKDPTNYDDSWIVYGNSIYPPYPVENEQWINLEGIVKMSADIKKLKKR